MTGIQAMCRYGGLYLAACLVFFGLDEPKVVDSVRFLALGAMVVYIPSALFALSFGLCEIGEISLTWLRECLISRVPIGWLGFFRKIRRV